MFVGQDMQYLPKLDTSHGTYEGIKLNLKNPPKNNNKQQPTFVCGRHV